jgi:Arc/MetJ-type ribon-helix-helix transcriptional regulator
MKDKKRTQTYVRVTKDMVESMDHLVHEGKYVTRSDLIREAISALIRERKSG